MTMLLIVSRMSKVDLTCNKIIINKVYFYTWWIFLMRSNPKISSIKTLICQQNETRTLNLALSEIQVCILEMYANK